MKTNLLCKIGFHSFVVIHRQDKQTQLTYVGCRRCGCMRNETGIPFEATFSESRPQYQKYHASCLEEVKPVCSTLEDMPVWFDEFRAGIPRGALVKLNPKFFI